MTNPYKEPLDQYDYSDTDFMDENYEKYAEFVGKYMIRFSYLEHHLNNIIAEVINERSHSLGYLITARMKMADKIDMIERYLKLAESDGYKTLERLGPLLPKIKALNKLRNQIAHANWATMQDNELVRIRTKVDEKDGVWFENIKLGYQDICRQTHAVDEMIVHLEFIWSDEAPEFA